MYNIEAVREYWPQRLNDVTVGYSYNTVSEIDTGGHAGSTASPTSPGSLAFDRTHGAVTHDTHT